MQDSIDVPIWYSNGSMMVLRDSLDPEHPESTYNYIKNVLNENPEDFGYYCTFLTEEQKHLLATIPDDALFRECKLREQALVQEEWYG